MDPVREGTVADLESIRQLLDVARLFERAPYLTVASIVTRQMIEDGITKGTSAILVRGDPIHSYAWVEIISGNVLMGHQIYASPGHAFAPLYDAIEAYAKEHDCVEILGIAYLISVARLMRHRGMKLKAMLLSKKVG